MSQDSPLFAKTFDLLVYLLPAVEKFPRSQRVVLGRRIQEIGLGFLDQLLAARKCTDSERPALLRQADVDLDRLRYLDDVMPATSPRCSATATTSAVSCATPTWSSARC